ncbi:hypothetical protein SteCoe_8143 [Stentor coeruleus]|uniref:Uncharacterized protein n=1 Tax=Stentor coeruleus TaxID=5963 RepID=A0A1R2CKY7_9CILI|nr:hypothetical protein SteCoe_8143 [Stentor coeruleus]
MITKYIVSETNKIFIGPSSSEFFYSFTPSVFYSSISKFPDSQTGYHLSEYSSPVPGTSHTIEELPEVAGLSVLINIDRRDYGLFTERYKKKTLFIIFSAMIGAISGIFSIILVIMLIVEKTYEKVTAILENIRFFNLLVEKRLRLQAFSDEYEHKGLIFPKFQS